jgi:hypothetical protein
MIFSNKYCINDSHILTLIYTDYDKIVWSNSTYRFIYDKKTELLYIECYNKLYYPKYKNYPTHYLELLNEIIFYNDKDSIIMKAVK